jgi:hypothetical protein
LLLFFALGLNGALSTTRRDVWRLRVLLSMQWIDAFALTTSRRDVWRLGACDDGS